MKYPLISAASLLLLAGCQCDRQTPAQEEVLRRLDSISKSLDDLNKNLEANRKIVQTAAASGMRGIDPVKIAAIAPLPEKPTDAQILSYIAAIKDASAGQNSYSPDQPQVALYRKIGPGHLKLLLPEIPGSPRNYNLLYALPELVGPADKEAALAALPTAPELITSVLKNGWAKEQKKVVFAILTEGRFYNLYDQKKTILALAETDEDRRLLLDAFVRNAYLNYLFDDLSRLPGVNPVELANRAWEQQRFSNDDFQRSQIALLAAKNGNVDALGYLINKIATKTREGYLDDNIPIFIAISTGQSLQPDKLLNWYGENRDKLVWDPATKRYLVKK